MGMTMPKPSLANPTTIGGSHRPTNNSMILSSRKFTCLVLSRLTERPAVAGVGPLLGSIRSHFKRIF